MRIEFNEKTDISELQKYNDGIEPAYAPKGSTHRGTAWCGRSDCPRCVGNLMLLPDNKIVGFIDTECSCGQKLNWSTAIDHI